MINVYCASLASQQTWPSNSISARLQSIVLWYSDIVVFDIPLLHFTYIIYLLYFRLIQTIPSWWVISLLHLFSTRLVIQKRVPSRLALRSRQVDGSKLMETKNLRKFGKTGDIKLCILNYVSLCIIIYGMSWCSSLLIHDIHACVFILPWSQDFHGFPTYMMVLCTTVKQDLSRWPERWIENSCMKTPIPLLISE